MAIITPASESFLSMIPPADFPVDGGISSPHSLRTVRKGGSSTALISVEVGELRVLTEFLAAFARYITDRHNPEASADTLRAYRAALRFYGDA